jgi:cysteine desulfurase/selenocysteine lyase
MVFVATLLSAFALLFVFSIVLSMLGLACPPEAATALRSTNPDARTSMYDIDKIRSDFPILGARGERQAAGLSRQRRLGAEAAGGDRRDHAGLFDGIRQRASRAALPVEPRDREIRGGARHHRALPRRADAEEIVFTSGTTEGINLVAYGWAMPRMQAGDEIVLTVAEHHANIVPWHFLRERQGVVLKWVDVDANGDLDPQAVIDAIGPKTKLVAITPYVERAGHHLRRETDLDAAHARGVPVLVDGSAGGGAHAGGPRRARRGFLRDHGPQALWPSGSGAIHIKRERMARCAPSWAAAT